MIDRALRLLPPFLSAVMLCGASSVAGRWQGAAQLPAREVPLVIDLAPDEAGVWRGSATSPGYGVKGAPLDKLTVTGGGEVTFTILGGLGGPELRGQLTASGTLAGEYKLAGNTAPFSLRRTGSAHVELPRMSTPVRQDAVGSWQGEFELMGYRRHALLELANTTEGPATAKFVVTGKRENHIAVTLVTDEGGYITVESRDFQIVLELRLEAGGGECRGTFAQGPFEAPVTLRRGAVR